MRLTHLKNVSYHDTYTLQNSRGEDQSYDLTYKFWPAPRRDHEFQDIRWYVLNLEIEVVHDPSNDDPRLPISMVIDRLIDEVLDYAYDVLVEKLGIYNLINFQPMRMGGITVILMKDPEGNILYSSDNKDSDTARWIHKSIVWREHEDELTRLDDEEARAEEENNV